MEQNNALARKFNAASLLRFALPNIAMMMLLSMYTIVDGMFISRFAGTTALSAINMSYPLNCLQMATGIMLGTGGSAIIARRQGEGRTDEARRNFTMLIAVALGIGLIFAVFGNLFLNPILRLLGTSELQWADCRIYTRIQLVFAPMLFLQTAFQTLFVTAGKPGLGLLTSVGGGITNVVLDGLFMGPMNMGVAGAAIATLGSRVISAVVVFAFLHNPSQEIAVRDYLHIRPDGRRIMRILSLGIPNGIENAMFQFGKLAIQSTVSTLGTIAIAAQAMTNILENLNGIAGIGIGIGMMTVVGQCLGAGRKDEAIYYIKKLTAVAEIVIIASCALVFLATKPVTILGGMEPESAKMCLYMVGWITVVKPIVWTLAFIPAYGMRAAGDVRFSMILSCISMWAFRVTLCIYLCRVHGFGPIAVWIGMFTDWTIRGIVFTFRFMGRRWLAHKVVEKTEGAK